MKTIKIFILAIVLAAITLLLEYMENQRYAPDLSLIDMNQNQITSKNTRGPASVAAASTTYQSALFAVSKLPAQPIVSPDAPKQPRASSNLSKDSKTYNNLNFFKRYVISQPTVPQALCSDGTKPIYYLKKGFGSGTNRWIIWLEGGGACGSDDPNNPLWCGLRKGLPLSTSNGFLATVNDLQGILSKSASFNPDFYSYNQIYVHYCSNDFWGGNGTQKIITKNTNEKFWFSGRKIIEALVLDLKAKHKFNNATNLILTGSSAGGAGIVMNADEIKKTMPQADVVTLVDAVNLIPFYQFYNKSNAPQDVTALVYQPEIFKQTYEFLPMAANTACLNALAKCTSADCVNSKYVCFLPGVASKFLSTPTFMANDQLDNALLPLYGLDFCIDNNSNEYMTWYNAYKAEVIKAAQTVSGYYLPRTSQHGLAPTHNWSTAVVEKGTEVRMRDVFAAWYFNRPTPTKKFIQTPSATLAPHLEPKPRTCK